MDLKSIFKSILPFEQILWSPWKHTKEELAAAKASFEENLLPLHRHNKAVVEEINMLITETNIWQLRVEKYDHSQLLVVGNYDLTYYHTLEIVFENVFYLSGLLWEWDTPYHPQETLRIEKNGPEQEYAANGDRSFFVFSSGEQRDYLIVGASSVSCNTNIDDDAPCQ